MTDSVEIRLPPHGPITPALSAADDRITVSNWLPPQDGIVPRVRIGRRWISTLWAIPIGAAALILLIALAQSLRGLHENPRSGCRESTALGGCVSVCEWRTFLRQHGGAPI